MCVSIRVCVRSSFFDRNVHITGMYLDSRDFLLQDGTRPLYLARLELLRRNIVTSAPDPTIISWYNAGNIPAHCVSIAAREKWSQYRKTSHHHSRTKLAERPSSTVDLPVQIVVARLDWKVLDLDEPDRASTVVGQFVVEQDLPDPKWTRTKEGRSMDAHTKSPDKRA